jgi:hypothetical protein
MPTMIAGLRWAGALVLTILSWLLFAMAGKKRCSEVTAKGPCRWPAKYGSRCLGCAARGGDADALVEQRRRLTSRKGKAASVDLGIYRDDPVRFAVEALGITPWTRQADFLRAVGLHDHVALKAGQKVSKTNALAILMLWFACTRPGSRVFFTNSSERQVSTVNYRELRAVIRGALLPLGITRVHDTPSRGVTFKNGSEILGFATNEEDRWGGLSGSDLLFIVDEASGVASAFFEAIEGNLAGDNGKLIVCGNPLRPADFFHDCFTTRSASWHTLTISSLESPNVVEGREIIRGLASAGFVQRTEDDYGRGSPFWMARIEGNFPSQSDYSVIGLADVLAAVQRHASAEPPADEPMKAGLDVSRGGPDESVGTVVIGSVVVATYVWRGLDGPTLAGRLAEALAVHRRGEERVQVYVDVIGVGSSPFDALVGHAWIDAVAVNVAEKPTIDDHYANLRAQLWFQGAKWIKTGAIPNDPKLIAELTAPTYSFDMKGNRKVEAKEDVKKRLHRSPDRADSLLLAIAAPEETWTAADYWSVTDGFDVDNDEDLLEMVREQRRRNA